MFLYVWGVWCIMNIGRFFKADCFQLFSFYSAFIHPLDNQRSDSFTVLLTPRLFQILSFYSPSDYSPYRLNKGWVNTIIQCYCIHIAYKISESKAFTQPSLKNRTNYIFGSLVACPCPLFWENEKKCTGAQNAAEYLSITRRMRIRQNIYRYFFCLLDSYNQRIADLLAIACPRSSDPIYVVTYFFYVYVSILRGGFGAA